MIAPRKRLLHACAACLLAHSAIAGERLTLASVRDETVAHRAANVALATLSGVDPQQASRLRAALDKRMQRLPEDASVGVVIQQALDEACVLEVTINPESRVKVSRGPAGLELSAGRWRAYLVKVVNQAGVTAPLRVASAQARGDVSANATPDAAPDNDAPDDGSRWLKIKLRTGPHQAAELTGRLLEYRVLMLRTEAAGFRSAVVAMDVGQGTADIGFRNDVLLTIKCKSQRTERGSEAADRRLLEQLPDRNPAGAARLVGRVLDAETGDPIACRLYLTSSQGERYTAESLGGDAVAYRNEPAHLPGCREVHTALSADPFFAELPAGAHEICVERGKEYRPASQRVRLSGDDRAVTLRMHRLVDLAAQGWYSGDVHVHRDLQDLPTAMHADDVNVTLPVTHWVSDIRHSPAQLATGRRLPREMRLDATHVIGTANTEYEINRIEGRDRLLGSLLVLNHDGRLEASASSLLRLRDEIRQRGGLIDLDKHAWPWSLVIAATMDADLFELANNHLWRTTFGLPRFGLEAAAPYMRLERSGSGLSERGWIDFGFETYYALLSCGLDLRVSAGSASGVHPTPLGFGRVYVQVDWAPVDGGLSLDAWLDGLAAGRSFVTTGPLLLAQLAGSPPGRRTRLAGPGVVIAPLRGEVFSEHPVERIEVVTDGLVGARLPAQNRPLPSGGYHSTFEAELTIEGACWTAVRVFEDRPDGRPRFAHTNPWRFTAPGDQLRPRPEQIDYLTTTVRRAIRDYHPVLNEETLALFREALDFYDRFSVRSARAE